MPGSSVMDAEYLDASNSEHLPEEALYCQMY